MVLHFRVSRVCEKKNTQIKKLKKCKTKTVKTLEIVKKTHKIVMTELNSVYSSFMLLYNI